ncbi:hypothetical protein [Acinetobacter sp. TSRC1-2]|uniref:hypothetical protein n=1 Tax=unclassified Acinetobacter TaxID=196816 RepID=UPI003CF5C292
MGESISEKLSGLYIAIILSVRLVVVFSTKKIIGYLPKNSGVERSKYRLIQDRFLSLHSSFNSFLMGAVLSWQINKVLQCRIWL